MRSSLLVLSLILAVPGAAFADEPSAAVRDADRAIHFADVAGRRLLGLLGEARLDRNPRQVRCVDGTLMQVNAFTRILNDRRGRLLAAERRGDAGAVRYEQMVIRNLHARLRELEREGRACVFPGAEAVDGRTVVEVIVDSGVPNEDPSILTEEERRRRL